MIATVIRNGIEFFTPDTRPYGLTYGQWTAKWWQWLASIPTDTNPAVDEDGRNAAVNQTDPYVWFLAGTVGGKSVHRECMAPARRSILFPVINYEMNPLEKPELKTGTELIRHVIEDEDDIINLEATIDGRGVPIFRVRSDPPLFSLALPPDNLFNTSSGGTTNATSDGYWVFLKSLEPGEHSLYFAGSCSAGSRNVQALYKLLIVD